MSVLCTGAARHNLRCGNAVCSSGRPCRASTTTGPGTGRPRSSRGAGATCWRPTLRSPTGATTSRALTSSCVVASGAPIRASHIRRASTRPCLRSPYTPRRVPPCHRATRPTHPTPARPRQGDFVLRAEGEAVEGGPRTHSSPSVDHEDGVLARLTTPRSPGEAGAHAVDGLAAVGALVLLHGQGAGELSKHTAVLQHGVLLAALVRHVTPVESPDDLTP